MATEQKALAAIAELTHPLAKADDLLFHRMTARETLSEPFEFDLHLLSPSEKLDFKDLLGKPMTVKLYLDVNRSSSRHFNGRVARFERLGTYPGTDYFAYRAVLRPWLWFMTLAQDNRIFQQKNVLEIVKAVCEAHSAIGASVLSKLSATPPTREYCVQYHESDFRFVSRLLEQEGIYYHFSHTATKHELVLCNGMGSHAAQAFDAKARYVAGGRAGSKDRFVRGWTCTVQSHSAKATLADFNFETPATQLLSTKASTHTTAPATLEVYDYPGAFAAKAGGDRYAELRISEHEARYPVFEGSTDLRGMTCGATFEISDLPDKTENGKYLLARTVLEVQEGVHDSSGQGEGSGVDCRFEAVTVKEPFRARSITPKALVHGPQTAFVVGPAGDEIHTDKHGRVKVQFHWDRLGKKDDKSSCWVRVSQPWAGKGFGFVQIPRIGDEVVVSFLEGDPDQPLITGRVYNAVNDPPFELPKHATVSGVKTRSSKGGSADTANELRFEDEKGSEYIRVQAEKTYYRHVKENAFDCIEGSATTTIAKDRFESVGNDQKVEIGKDHWHKVGTDLHVDVAADTFFNVGAGTDITPGKAFKLTVGTEMAVDVGQKALLTAGQEIALNAGMKLSVEAGMTITLKAGGSFISIGPSGVDISGLMVKINSGGSGGSAAKAKKAKKPKKPEAIKKWQDPMPKK